ncbi:MAG: helix-turn-helix domain-containing protein [Eubacteriales bacterium]|nr:helix-turn-helix domain-containing protein [Eubacteriales bacterium]
MEQQKIGSFLKELRKEKNLTQEQLAEKLNVSGRTVSRWETGSNMPDISLLVELAEFYEVSIPEIIGGERKSENMNEEVKKVATAVVEYAGEEKTVLLKNLRKFSIIGLIALIVGLIMESVNPDTGIPIIEALRGLCFGLGIGALVCSVLYSTGKLEMLHTKKSKYKKTVLTITIAIVILFLGAATTATVLR